MTLLYCITLSKLNIKLNVEGTLTNAKMFKVKEYTDVGCVRRIRIPQTFNSKTTEKVLILFRNLEEMCRIFYLGSTSS